MTADQARRIRAGDVSAFEELFRELHAPLCEVVDSFVRSQAVAEEIVQDLFFTVWVKRARLEAESMRSYLFRAARNRALHQVRHDSVVRRIGRLADARPEVAGVAMVADESDAAQQPDENLQRLRAAIDLLPPRTRLALVLRIDHGMNDQRIAEAMGISLKGVEKLIASAKRALRERFAGEGDLQPLLD
ncbi:MAG: sigma-70 family RNA polymerase sigma factor [Gemmatimonadota bacterium]|nr:sigma-70 family RNA polymerase sigma factor [Gemmatimonadota bacterium]